MQITTHSDEHCAGEYCPIHNPSDHPLNDAPMVLRTDRGIPLIERQCEHGVGHPDPDSVAFFVQHAESHTNPCCWLTVENAKAQGVHGCDGCCARTPR